MMETQIQPYTEIESRKFDAITPSQFITFTMENTIHHRLLSFPLHRVAVLDSPLANADDESPVIAAIIVPKDREKDWVYSTESGHMQLLFKYRNVSRLILIGDLPNETIPSVYKRLSVRCVTNSGELESLQNDLQQPLWPFHPTVSFSNGPPETLFLTDDDDVAYRVTVDTFLGPIVGGFLVEDIELVGYSDRNKQLRRRLRFKRMPRVVQSETLLVPIIPYDEGTTQTDLESLRKIENARFEADTEILVREYLIAMVSGLFLVASHLNTLFTPRALCLGVGGGVLLNFLYTQMGFEVTGVEADNMVVSVATEHFGFKTGPIRVVTGDAIEIIQNFPPYKPRWFTHEKKDCTDYPPAKFDIVFVDLDSTQAGNGFSAPPPGFIKKPVFEGLKSVLDVGGVVIINVVDLNEGLYATLVEELKEIFHKVYKIDVKNEDNGVVVIATVSPASPDEFRNIFLKKLKSVIPLTYMDSTVEL